MAISIRSITTNNGTGNPIQVVTSETPSATLIGDLVLVIHYNDFYALSNMPTPTATGSPTVTAVSNGTGDNGTNDAHVKSYTYVANTAGAQTVSVTETGSADEDKGLAVYVFSGVDTANPIDVAGNTVSGNTVPADPWVFSAVSPSTASSFLVAHGSRGGSGGTTLTATIDAGMTEQYNFATAPQTAPNGMGATQQLVASGSTGIRSFDPGATARPWAGVLIAVRTATVKYVMLRPAVVTR